jgi:dynein heavy chain
MSRVILAMEKGQVFLIENMDENFDCKLMPIISKIYYVRGKKNYVMIDDNEVEVHKDFKVYLHTKLSNPHYEPCIHSEITMINFSVTQEGLEEQLLGLVVKHERSDMAAQKISLTLQQNLFTIRVKQVEDDILSRLSDAQGDITEDTALIIIIEKSKKISDEIKVKLIQSQNSNEIIDDIFEKYRLVARRGALLFIMINNLNRLHTYYSYSINSFIDFFLLGIKSTQWPSHTPSTRRSSSIK